MNQNKYMKWFVENNKSPNRGKPKGHGFEVLSFESNVKYEEEKPFTISIIIYDETFENQELNL